MGQLNELQIRAAKPRNTEYLLADGDGLYLRVRPTAKVWIYRYKREGKEAKLSLGHYPTLSLAAARKKSRAEAEKLAVGVDPRLSRREDQERERAARLNTFELMARAWHAQAWKDRQWSANYAGKVIRHLELHIFPWIGALTMDTVAPTELVRCLHRIRDRGHLETAQRVREAVQHVYQYAVDTGTLDPGRNFVNGRTGGLPAPRARHYAAITDPEKSDSCFATSPPIKAMSSPVRPCAFHRCCFSVLGSCAWRTGKTSTSSRSCGAVLRRT